MFSRLFGVLTSLMDEHLPGWEILDFRYWKAENGNTYCEVKIQVFEEELHIRLREHEDSLRVVNATLHKKSQRDRRIIPNEQTGSRSGSG